MHCRSCELLIEDELKKVPGVKSVSVSHQTGIADVDCECELDQLAVSKAIETAGYSVGQEEKPLLISKNWRDYKDLGVAFFIATALFLLANALGLFHISTGASSGSYSNLLVVLLIGLTAGVSTCMALVGGLVLGASAKFAAQHPQASGIQKFTPHLYFNLGRIASYFVLGAAVGLAGSFFQLSTSVLGLLTVTVGLVMLLLGGQLIDIFPVLKRISFTLPKGVSRALGIRSQHVETYSNKNAVLMGASTFFLPCGFTQAMQLYAMSTGSPLQGALTLGIFAIGTSPGLLGIGGISSMVKGAAANIFFKTAGVVVILLSLFNISNGLNLLGAPTVFAAMFQGTLANAQTPNDPNVTVKNGVQTVRMIQDGSGYRPNTFRIQKGIPTRWIVTSTDTYTCAASIISQKIGIRAGLKVGENVFEFTPSETGTIRFSCSMGMYNGSFTVVDASDAAAGGAGSPIDYSALQDKVPTKPKTGSASAGGSCGAGGGGCGCGGAKKAAAVQNPNQPATTATTQSNVQVIKTTYTALGDISPNAFTVKSNQPVRFEIEARDNGEGCMGSVTIPTLTKKIEVFTKGETTTFEFTPTAKGIFPITCGMGVPRGQIEVN